MATLYTMAKYGAQLIDEDEHYIIVSYPTYGGMMQYIRYVHTKDTNEYDLHFECYEKAFYDHFLLFKSIASTFEYGSKSSENP